MTPQESARIIQRYASESVTCIKTKGNLSEVVHRQEDIIALASDIVTHLDTQPVQPPTRKKVKNHAQRSLYSTL